MHLLLPLLVNWTIVVTVASPATGEGTPLPVVTLNRCMLVAGVAMAILLQQPWLIAVLFLMLLSAVTLGPAGSLPFQLGQRTLGRRIERARRAGHVEDRRLMRFNNLVALVLFGLSLVAFAVGFPLVGWILATMVLAAAVIALAGFCIGCFLFYRFRIAQYRWDRAA